MPTRYTVKELRYWSRKIEKLASSFGLDFYPQEFEVVNYKTMMAAQAYSGMPSIYPHHSFGKSFELLMFLYSHRLTYLPYELVINSDPCLARLMKDNDLAMQILTMAHVYGHNNFFKNNQCFLKFSNAGLALGFFRSAADMIRSYSKDPAIGPKAVEECITAAHGIRYHCRDSAIAPGRTESQDLLLFLINDPAAPITDWQKNIARMIVESFSYFRPMIMTKIMNEGWASFWHYRIIENLRLPQAIRTAIGEYHSHVVRFPDDPSSINPYFIGFEIWKDIEKKDPRNLFKAMREESDPTFLEKYMDQELMVKLGLFIENVQAEKDIIAEKISDQSDYRTVKEALIKNIGLNTIPSIYFSGTGEGSENDLILQHAFEGRHLERKMVPKVLEYIYYFCKRPVVIKTRTYNTKSPYAYRYDGKAHTSRRSVH
jgi:stage V sporulation protein R